MMQALSVYRALSKEEQQKVQKSISDKIRELLGVHGDIAVLVEYIAVMLQSDKHRALIEQELEAFLQDQSPPFVAWLCDELEAIGRKKKEEKKKEKDTSSSKKAKAKKDEGKSVSASPSKKKKEKKVAVKEEKEKTKSRTSSKDRGSKKGAAPTIQISELAKKCRRQGVGPGVAVLSAEVAAGPALPWASPKVARGAQFLCEPCDV